MTCEKCGEWLRTYCSDPDPGNTGATNSLWCPVCDGGYIKPPKLLWNGSVAQYGPFLLCANPQGGWRVAVAEGLTSQAFGGSETQEAAQQAAEAALLGILRGEA